MKFQKIATAILSVIAALLLAPSAALAQGVAVFTKVDGKGCPTGFVDNGKTCDATKSMTKGYIGYVGNGKCASGYSNHGTYCSMKVKEEKSSGKSSSSSSASSIPEPTSDQTFFRKSITARVKKANEIDLCPTGYFTNRQDISECVTHFSDAPKSRLASGGKCSSGETLERGKYCTGATTMAASEMSSAITYDINELYTMYGVKHGKMPTLDDKPPEVAAPALNALNAEKDAERAKTASVDAERVRKAQAEETALNNHRNEQQRIACEAGRPNFPNGFPPGHPCEGFGAVAGAGGAAGAGLGGIFAGAVNAGAPAAAPANAKEALKQDAGKALRGLFGR